MAVFNTLISLRKAKNLTQQQIADILNIKRTTYASYETGRVNMDSNLLQKLAGYYKISVDEILKGGASDRPDFKIKRQPTDKFIALTKTEMATIKSAINVITSKLVYLESKITKRPSDKVSLEIHRSMREEYNQLLAELEGK